MFFFGWTGNTPGFGGHEKGNSNQGVGHITGHA